MYRINISTNPSTHSPSYEGLGFGNLCWWLENGRASHWGMAHGKSPSSNNYVVTAFKVRNSNTLLLVVCWFLGSLLVLQ